jgi:hypothetical protein
MTKRMSVSLDVEDEQIVRAFAAPGTAESAALADWASMHGLDPARLGSEASVLRALVRAGADRLREQVLDTGYAALAIETTGDEHADTRAARDRYVARTERQATE